MIVFASMIVLFVLIVLMKTLVPLMILAGTAGFVLSTLWGPEFYNFLVENFPDLASVEIRSLVSITLFILPPILIGLHFRGTQSSRWIQQIVPAIFWVVFTLSMTVRLLPSDLSDNLSFDSVIIGFSQTYLNLLILGSILVAIVEFMSQHGALLPRGRGRSKH